jgi:hypothetical protein
MEPEPAQDPSHLIRAIERLRKAPPEKRQVYALGFAAGCTLAFAAAVFVWGAIAGGGEDGILGRGARELVAAVASVFKTSAPADSSL